MNTPPHRSRFRIPGFPEVCWPHRPLLKSATPLRGTAPRFVCHGVRLEIGCLHQRPRGHFVTAMGGLDQPNLRVCWRRKGWVLHSLEIIGILRPIGTDYDVLQWYTVE